MRRFSWLFLVAFLAAAGRAEEVRSVTRDSDLVAHVAARLPVPA